VTDPLDLQIPKRLDEPVAELTRAGVDSHLGHAEAQNDLPVQALDIEQVDVRQDTVLAPGKEMVRARAACESPNFRACSRWQLLEVT
jgi:hypothetical protein